MSSQTIEAIDRNIKEAKAIVDLGTALERLRVNKDFKKVVLEGYFEQEAIRLVHLKADAQVQNPDYQRSIITQMDAIGALSQYFNTVLHKSSLAGKAIEADEETRDELLAEELTNE